MNSAKKIANKQNEKATKKTVSAAKGDKTTSEGGYSDTKRIVIGAICIIVVLALCIGVAVQQLKPKVVLTVDKTRFSMEDMMYPIYERESQYSLYDEMYQMYTGQSVWDNTYMGSDRKVSKNATNAQGLKDEIINAETAYQVLYQEAGKAGYSLDDADKKEVKKQVEDALKGLSVTQKLKLGISKGNLTKRFEKRKLADKYKAAQEEALNATVDEKAATKTVSKKDYREYDVQYYAVSKSFTDDKGNSKTRTDSEMKKLCKELETLKAKAKTAKDFKGLLDDKKSDNQQSGIEYNEASFTEKDGWTMLLDKKLLSQVKSMKNNEISGILEDKKSGYTLFVKMIDNNSTKSYDEACKAAIETAQNTAYDNWYAGVLANYTTKVNTEIWDEIKLGSVTTDIVTIEDLKKMQEEASSDATSK